MVCGQTARPQPAELASPWIMVRDVCCEVTNILHNIAAGPSARARLPHRHRGSSLRTSATATALWRMARAARASLATCNHGAAWATVLATNATPPFSSRTFRLSNAASDSRAQRSSSSSHQRIRQLKSSGRGGSRSRRGSSCRRRRDGTRPEAYMLTSLATPLKSAPSATPTTFTAPAASRPRRRRRWWRPPRRSVTRRR